MGDLAGGKVTLIPPTAFGGGALPSPIKGEGVGGQD